MNVPISIRIASLLLWISTIGLGIPCVMAIHNLMHGRGIPYVFGFPAYGGGGFERHDLVTSVPMLIGFLVFCLIEGYAGWLLWNGYNINETPTRTVVLIYLSRFLRSKCHCGNDIWVIGSAQNGNSCFTCITGESHPKVDYEIYTAPANSKSI